MVKFKIGDKVIAKKHTPYIYTDNGWKGTVVAIGSGSDIKVEGISSTGNAHGYWVESKYFDLDVSGDQKIIVTSDGKTTTAKMYNGKRVTKTATAKCSPEDEFDFKTGAVIAFTRLMDGELKFKEKSKVEGLDWKAFKAHKIAVKVTKDNYKNFVTAARKHGCDWYDGSDFNPFDVAYDVFFRLTLGNKLKRNEIYIVIAEGKCLKITHFLGDMEEFVW